MNLNRLEFLLQKHIRQQLSAVELEELFSLVDEISDDEFFSVWQKLNKKPTLSTFNDESISLLKENVLARIKKNNQFVIIRYLHSKWTVAAVFLSCVAISLTFYLKYNNQNFSTELASNDIHIQLDSIPKLTVYGKTIGISHQQVALLKEIGISVPKEGLSTIDLRDLNTKDNQKLTLSTPKGYTTKVYLSDGSFVWLNSNTSITLSEDFNSEQRKIKLNGEAYFEVASNKKPFIVEFAKGELKVLGTHFNVSAYNDINYCNVALLEGKVEVKNNKNTLLLAPGQQALWSSLQSGITKDVAYTDELLAWTHGDFVFNELGIPDMLNLLKQWYDIEEVQLGNYSDIKISGIIKQSKSLRQVLNHIEKISNHKFHIQGRRVVVGT